jgi:ABC-type glutathione transport system ATPase component
MKKIIEIKNVSYRYNQKKTDGISDLTFDIFKGEILCLVGPSGCGKTTTAKLVAEQILPQKGSIKFNNNLKISFVPQNSDLPESMTVLDYLKSCVAELDDEDKVENLIRSTLLLLNISNETHSLLVDISGGQRQRVIIASALILNPDIIILDEPFGHLDERLRAELMLELFNIFKDKHISCLWVTHEIKEALSYSHRILLLNYGLLQQLDTPENIYQRPVNLFTAEFFGQNNAIAAKLISESDDELIVNAFNKEVAIPKPIHFSAKEHQDVLLILKPEFIQLNHDGDHKGKVQNIFFQGPVKLLQVYSTYEQPFWVYVPGHTQIKINDKVHFNIDYSKIYCLDEI